MSKKKRIDDDDFDQDEFDGGELVTVSNGSKTLEVSRKAFHSAYESKGFREVGADDFESDEDLTPQQKAARTRAAKKDAESRSSETEK